MWDADWDCVFAKEVGAFLNGLEHYAKIIENETSLRAKGEVFIAWDDPDNCILVSPDGNSIWATC